MAKLFGVTSVSLYNVFVSMGLRYGRKRISILTSDLAKTGDKKYRRRIRRAKLILAGSIRELLANAKILNRRTAPVIVFDSPVILRNYPIYLLDSQPDSKFIGRFQHGSVDYATLIDAIEHPDAKRHKLVRSTRAILPQIIQEYTVSGFLDKFNSLLYSITKADNRGPIRNAIVRFVFGQLTLEEFNKQLQNAGVRLNSKSKPLYQAMVDYLATPKGDTLRQALHEAIRLENQAGKKTGARRTVRYKELCEKYSVDRFDLRNLILLYRGLPK